MVVMAPKDENEVRDMLFTALQYKKGPVAIRYPRGETCGLTLRNHFKSLPIGRAEVIQEGNDLAVLAIGDMVQAALAAAGRLLIKGIQIRVVNARFVKPLDKELILDTARRFPVLLTLENNTTVGGFGAAVAETLGDAHIQEVSLYRLGIPDRFVSHGSQNELYSEIGIDTDHLVKKIEQILYHHHRDKRKVFSAK
jgi:1-deoxy-D-xylulose-5-phosphate synthase